MTKNHQHEPRIVPKQMLHACFALILFTVFATFASQISGIGSFEREERAVVAERHFHFRDRADGGITVADARTMRTVREFDPDEGGFVRVAMRAHAFSRRARGLGDEAPVALVKTAEGRLLLTDPATGKKIGLSAFGPQNRALFEKPVRRAESRSASPQDDRGGSAVMKAMFKREEHATSCTIRVLHSADYLEAHLELDNGLTPAAGDRVRVHGAPIVTPFRRVRNDPASGDAHARQPRRQGARSLKIPLFTHRIVRSELFDCRGRHDLSR